MKIARSLLRRLAATAVITFCPALGAGQQAGGAADIRAGQALPGAARIKAGTQQFACYVVHGGGRQLRLIVTRDIEVGEREGREVVHVVEHFETPQGEAVNDFTMLRHTLLPVSSRSTGLATVVADFGPRGARGSLTPDGGETRRFDEKWDAPMYNILAEDEIMQSLPLAPRYVARYMAYDPGKQVHKVTLRVVGTERIPTIDGRHIDTWVLSREDGGTPITFWVVKGTQEQVKVKVVLPNGDVFWRVRLYPVDN